MKLSKKSQVESFTRLKNEDPYQKMGNRSQENKKKNSYG